MTKSILEDAMRDAKILKETAVENAKNVLVEAISPQIKEFVDSQLGETELELEMPMALQEFSSDQLMALAEKMKEKEEKEQGEDEMGPDFEMYAGKKGDDEELDLPEEGVYETEETFSMPPVAEAEDKKDEDEEDVSEGQEFVEITQEDLKKAFSEVVRGEMAIEEAQVTKGFGDAEDPTIKNAGGKQQTGIADEKSGEHQWKDEKAPAGEDWTVKEAAFMKRVSNLSRRNTVLEGENVELKEACEFLRRNLNEVSLFSNKLLYTNKVLRNTDLNGKQRIGIIETFDKAQSLREVQLIYKSLCESLKIAGVLGEGKRGKKTLKGPKSSRYTTSSSAGMLKEAMENDSKGDCSARFQTLAGLDEIK